MRVESLFRFTPLQKLIWQEILRVTRDGTVEFVGQLRIEGLPQAALGSPLRLFEERGLIEVSRADPENKTAGRCIRVLLTESDAAADDDDEAPDGRTHGVFRYPLEDLTTVWRTRFPNGACYCHGVHPPGFRCARVAPQPITVSPQRPSP